MATTIENIYQGYQEARQIEKKATGYVKDTKMAGQAVGYGLKYRFSNDAADRRKVEDSLQYFISKNKVGAVTVVLYNLFERKDAASLSGMVDYLNGHLGKTPVGQLMMSFYRPHFKLLTEVARIVEKAEGELKNYEAIGDRLWDFKQKSGGIIRSTEFDEDEYKSGPFRLIAHLQMASGTVGTNAALDAVDFVAKVVSMAASMVDELDKLLAVYVKLATNYERIYREGLAIQREKGLVGEAFAGMGGSRMVTGYAQNMLDAASHYPTVPAKLDKLIRNRNDWAEWVGRQPRSREQYYEQKLA